MSINHPTIASTNGTVRDVETETETPTQGLSDEKREFGLVSHHLNPTDVGGNNIYVWGRQVPCPSDDVTVLIVNQEHSQ
jgi:hypothetical protein